MSDSMHVFIRSSKLPTVDDLRSEVKSMGLELEEWDEDLVEIEGYWPGEFRGKEAGFEFMASEVDPEDLENWGVEQSSLEGRDYLIEFTYRTEEDVYASAICIVAFCKLSDGIAFNDDDELKVNSSNCLDWAKQQGVEM